MDFAVAIGGCPVVRIAIACDAATLHFDDQDAPVGAGNDEVGLAVYDTVLAASEAVIPVHEDPRSRRGGRLLGRARADRDEEARA